MRPLKHLPVEPRAPLRACSLLLLCLAGALATPAPAAHAADAPPPAPPGVDADAAPVSEAMDLLAAGRLDPQAIAPRLQPPHASPPGLLSVWLAAGGTLDRPVPEAVDAWPLEPRLFALRAARALERGELQRASRWVLPALQLSPHDAWLDELAARLGWHTFPPPGPALPAPPDPRPPAWPWIAAGLAAAALLAWSARQTRSRAPAVALIVGAACAIGLPLGAPVPLPDVPAALVAPSELGVCQRGPARLTDTALTVPIRCDGLTRVVRVLPAAAAAAYLRTPQHALEVAGRDALSPSLRDAVAAVAADLETAERSGWRLDRALAPPPHPDGWPHLADRAPASLARLRIAVGAVAASLVILLAMAARALLLARRALLSHRREAWTLLAILGLSALAHALVPGRMTMVYGGYDLVAHLVAGIPPRYGPGAVATYGPLLWLAGHDHAWVVALNRLLGLACVVVAWDLGRVLWRQGPAARLLSALALATSPLLLRAHASESIVVPAALCFLAALRLLVRPARPELAAAVILLITSGLIRPDAAVMATTVPLWAWLCRAGAPRVSRRQLAIPLGAAAVLAALYALHLASTASEMASRDSLLGPSQLVGPAIAALANQGALGDPAFTPVGLWPLLALAIAWHLPRRPALATMGLALGWIVITSVDLARVSVPRLHEPPVLLLLPLAATGMSALLARARARRSAARPLLRAAAALLALSWLSSCAFEAWQHFRPTLSDAEEALWRDSIEALPDGGGCLFAMSYADPPDPQHTARYNPVYLLRARRPDWHVLPLSQLETARPGCPRRLVLLGTRCYAQIRDHGEPTPPIAEPFPICQRARSAAASPLIEREVPITDAISLPMYPAAGVLRLGLYDAGATSTTPTPPAAGAPPAR
ncbi:MAG: hypothetical protein H6744_19450 [Deltaproteobacteria bacterium]|nr:hypothetical protein [Deltaproteobacteria bacterium]